MGEANTPGSAGTPAEQASRRVRIAFWALAILTVIVALTGGVTLFLFRLGPSDASVQLAKAGLTVTLVGTVAIFVVLFWLFTRTFKGLVAWLISLSLVVAVISTLSSLWAENRASYLVDRRYAVLEHQLSRELVEYEHSLAFLRQKSEYLANLERLNSSLDPLAVRSLLSNMRRTELEARILELSLNLQLAHEMVSTRPTTLSTSGRIREATFWKDVGIDPIKNPINGSSDVAFVTGTTRPSSSTSRLVGWFYDVDRNTIRLAGVSSSTQPSEWEGVPSDEVPPMTRPIESSEGLR